MWHQFGAFRHEVQWPSSIFQRAVGNEEVLAMLVKEGHLCTSVGSFSLQCMLLQNGIPVVVTEPLQAFHVCIKLTPAIFMLQVEKLGQGGFQGAVMMAIS